MVPNIPWVYRHTSCRPLFCVPLHLGCRAARLLDRAVSGYPVGMVAGYPEGGSLS